GLGSIPCRAFVAHDWGRANLLSLVAESFIGSGRDDVAASLQRLVLFVRIFLKMLSQRLSRRELLVAVSALVLSDVGVQILWIGNVQLSCDALRSSQGNSVVSPHVIDVRR